MKSQRLFGYLSRFTDWRPYEHRVLAHVDGKLLLHRGAGLRRGHGEHQCRSHRRFVRGGAEAAARGTSGRRAGAARRMLRPDVPGVRSSGGDSLTAAPGIPVRPGRGDHAVRGERSDAVHQSHEGPPGRVHADPRRRSPRRERRAGPCARGRGFLRSIEAALAEGFLPIRLQVDRLLASTSWDRTWSRMSELLDGTFAVARRRRGQPNSRGGAPAESNP